MADAVIWSESARLMWVSAQNTLRLHCGRAPRVIVVATEDAVAIDLASEHASGERSIDRDRRLTEIAMRDVDAIELEGRPTARSSFGWELLTGFAAERDPTLATTGMVIRSYRHELWVLRLDGDFLQIEPRLAEFLAHTERPRLPA